MTAGGRPDTGAVWTLIHTVVFAAVKKNPGTDIFKRKNRAALVALFIIRKIEDWKLQRGQIKGTIKVSVQLVVLAQPQVQDSR
jgi:hypothetical protein